MLKARKVLGCKAMTKKESEALTHLEAVGKSLSSQHLCSLSVKCRLDVGRLIEPVPT